MSKHNNMVMWKVSNWSKQFHTGAASGAFATAAVVKTIENTVDN